MDISCRVFEYGSPEYDLEVALRTRILRDPLGLRFSAEELKLESGDLHFGAFHQGEMIGCLLLRPHSFDVVKMRQVAVEEKLQGQGVGTQLVRFAEQAAKEKGFKEMILHARDKAVPFYLALRYETYGQPFEEVGIPHAKMRKML